MIASNGLEYRLSDTSWGKYDSGFHAWLVENVDPDEYDGDTDFGGASLFGRRVDCWDTQGFHSLQTFGTAEEALAEYTAWADDFNRPEVEQVSDPRDVKYIVRTHNEDWMSVDGVFSHPSFPGVAVRVYSPGIVGTYWRDGEREYSADESSAWVYMVGDDSLTLVDSSDLVELSEDDYCAGCGQLGCGWC